MQNVSGFSGRLGPKPYAILTFCLAAIVLGLAAPSGEPFKLLLTTPWTVLGRAMDGLIQIDSNRLPGVDVLVSLVILALFSWVLLATTVRRLRDIGQSPWWTLLIVFSGSLVAVMVVLSFLPSQKASRQTWTDAVKA